MVSFASPMARSVEIGTLAFWAGASLAY
jgi:hypothetical protein